MLGRDLSFRNRPSECIHSEPFQSQAIVRSKQNSESLAKLVDPLIQRAISEP